MPRRQECDADPGLQEGVAGSSLSKLGRGVGGRDVVTQQTPSSRASRRQNFELPARNLCRQRQRRAEVRPLGDRSGRLHPGLAPRQLLFYLRIK